jgi:hypothetical protein
MTGCLYYEYEPFRYGATNHCEQPADKHGELYLCRGHYAAVQADIALAKQKGCPEALPEPSRSTEFAEDAAPSTEKIWP